MSDSPAKPAAVGLIEKLIWPVALVVAVAFVPWELILPERSKPEPSPQPVVSDMEDIRELALKGSKADRKALGDFLGCVAHQFERLDSIESEAVRGFLDDSESYRLAGTDLADSFPGFGKLRDKYMDATIGNESRVLSKGDIEDLEELFSSMSKEFLR